MRAAKAASGRAPTPDDDDHIARRYHSLVIDGRLKAAVRLLPTEVEEESLHQQI